MVNSLSHVRSVFSVDEKLLEGLNKYLLKLVTPAVEKVGWEFPPGEDYLTSNLRRLLITTAGGCGHEA